MDENSLIVRAQTGDREALGELLMGHREACYALALRLAGHAENAEDICQDAFVRASRDVSAWRPTGAFRSWLFALIVHAYGDRVDSERARRTREKETAMERGIAQADGIGEAERAELRRNLDQALRRLDDSRRVPIILRYEQGLTDIEAAAVLSLPEGTVKSNIRRGLEELRGLMTRAGYGAAVAGGIETALLQAPVVSAPASLTAFIKSLAAAGSTKAVGTAAGAAASGLAIGWKIAGGAALAALLAFGGREAWRHFRPAIAPPTAAAQPEPSLVITPRGSNAQIAFDQLLKKGLRVVQLGNHGRLIIPVEARYKPIDGRELVRTIAKRHNLTIAWLNDGKLTVLHRRAADPGEVARLVADLKSRDVVKRREAAELAASTETPEVVRPLLSAAADPDAETADRAARGCRSLGLEAVAAIGGENALPFLEKTMEDKDAAVRYAATAVLGGVGGEKAVALVEEALRAKDANIRAGAVYALGQTGGDRPAVLIEKALTDKDALVRWAAISALGQVGGERALPLLEKALTDEDAKTRSFAVTAVGQVGGEKALAHVEKAMQDRDALVRGGAVSVLWQFDGDKPLELLAGALAEKDPGVYVTATLVWGECGWERGRPFLEKALGDANPIVRRNAASALAAVAVEGSLPLVKKALGDADAQVRGNAAQALIRVGGAEAAPPLIEKALEDAEVTVRRSAAAALRSVNGDRAVPLVEKAMKDSDAVVRQNAVAALRQVRGERALPLAGKALDDADTRVRWNAIAALGALGGERPRDLLLNRLAVEKDPLVARLLVEALKKRFPGDPAVEKAIKDFNLPEAPKPGPRPKSQTKPEPIPAPPEVF